LHQARSIDWRRGQRLGKADRLLEWTKPRCCPRLLEAEQFAALPATLQVRQVRLQARLKGFRTRSLVLVTTLVDPVAYPAATPRAKKRRPKTYQLLTKPRHKMKLTQRRNRHKAPLT
jgi:hypothetical protein